MHILDQIITKKRVEVEVRKKKTDVSLLCARPAYTQSTLSLVQALLAPRSSGIIAEFKRCSPSKGIINDTANPVEVTQGYQTAGAAAVSILTDEYFFKGNDNDMLAARPVLQIPILRKEFIVDAWALMLYY
jgi:indole-3-glycerol phosphate synthase